MPILIEVRRLKKAWPHIVRRVESYMAGIPADGVSLVEFEEACLGEVFIYDRPAILKALKGKQLVFPVRDGVAVRVFAQKPAKRRYERGDTSALDQCLRVLAPHMRVLSGITEMMGGIEDREGRRREIESARQIADLVKRHVDRGLDLDEIRAGIALTFHPRTVESLRVRQPILVAGSKRTAFQALPERSRRIPNGLPPHEKIMALVKKAGPKGVTKSSLVNSFQPRRPTAEIGGLLDEIEEAGFITSEMMQLGGKGRPARRYFHADFGLPMVLNGRPIFH